MERRMRLTPPTLTRWTLLAAAGAALLLAGAGCGGSRSGATADRVAKELSESRSAEAQAFDRAYALLREAQRAEVAEKDDIAIAKYRESIASYRDIPAAWNNLGSLLMRKGENLQAAEAFITASELSPTDARPLYNLGALWHKQGDLREARKWYDQAIARDDRFLPALRQRVLVDQMLDNPDTRSLEFAKKALLLEKDPWWIERLKRAEIRFRTSENEQASESRSN